MENVKLTHSIILSDFSVHFHVINVTYSQSDSMVSFIAFSSASDKKA